MYGKIRLSIMHSFYTNYIVLFDLTLLCPPDQKEWKWSKVMRRSFTDQKNPLKLPLLAFLQYSYFKSTFMIENWLETFGSNWFGETDNPILVLYKCTVIYLALSPSKHDIWPYKVYWCWKNWLNIYFYSGKSTFRIEGAQPNWHW